MNSLWPKIDNHEAAQSAMKNAASVAFIICTFTGIVALRAIIAGHSIAGISGSALVDAILFALIGWRTYKYSRVAAISGLLLYLLEAGWRIVGASTSTPVPAFALIIVFIVYFVHGVRGAMFLHQAPPSAQPSTAPAK